jgi:hypothetical protein
MSQTSLLPGCPLIEPGGDHQQPRENDAPTGHGFGKQSGSIENKLQSGRDQTEFAPDRHVPKRELAAQVYRETLARRHASAATNKIAGAALGSIIMMIHIRKIIAA